VSKTKHNTNYNDNVLAWLHELKHTKNKSGRSWARNPHYVIWAGYISLTNLVIINVCTLVWPTLSLSMSVWTDRGVPFTVHQRKRKKGFMQKCIGRSNLNMRSVTPATNTETMKPRKALSSTLRAVWIGEILLLSVRNPSTGWAATDPAFTRKSTQFLFHALRDGGKHCISFVQYQIKDDRRLPTTGYAIWINHC
jgi:hypothetical protein